MDKQELKDRLITNGLEKYFEILEPHLRNTIRLYQKAADENEIKVAQTKIGGKPDLPPTVSWMMETNKIVSTEKKFLIFNSKKEEIVTKPLSFIAQINLSEVSQFDDENVLLKSGILYFFYSAEQEAWGFDYLDKNKFKIFLFDGNINEITKAEFPNDLPEHARFKPCTVEIKQEISLPSYGHEIYNAFSDEDSDVFWDVVYNDGNINKLLGYSDNVQDDMELECELVTNGLYCGDSTGYNDPKAKTLEPNAKNWRLLLQIDSNEENEMMWGDAGRLYFWIRKEDLANRDFEKSWFCLQCY